MTLASESHVAGKPIQDKRRSRPARTGLWFVIVGLLLSLAMGVGAVVAQESFDGSVRGPADIRQLLQVPALASIPIIVTEADRKRRRRINRFSWGGGVAAMLLAAVVVHLFVRPLDVVWISLLHRFGI